jgi:hypothetical protein
MINSPLTLKIFFLLAVSPMLSATQTSAIFCYFFQPLVEIKTGYFFFSNSTMRTIYNRGGLDLQLCASYPLLNLTPRWIVNAYGAIEYFHRSGKSLNEDAKTSLWLIPINIGLKPTYAINANLYYYFAIGPRYFYIHQHNHSSYVYKNKSRNGLGFFVNTGFNYAFSNHFVVDIFGEYSYAKTRFHSGRSDVYTRNIQIGGFTLGGGLGYGF